jgi:endonuclease/exonuclease/phosphatase family metal-dependent hydrolase
MKRLSFFWFILTSVAFSLFAITPPAFSQTISQGNGDLRIMTYNIDEGTDYIEVQNAQDGFSFLLAVGDTITQVRAINTKSRMRAVAKQIVAAAPTLVSLQEVNQWSTGPYNPGTGQCGTLTIENDMLADLTKALKDQGAQYAVVNMAKQWQLPSVDEPWQLPAMPGLIRSTGQFLCVGVTDYIVMLARTDLPALYLSNAQHERFNHMLLFKTAVGDVPFPRSWMSVDVDFNGKAFRLIGTHLDSVDPTIRREQAQELRDGPAKTSLPVVIAMDSNAQAAPLPQEDTYTYFVSEAEFIDAWTEKFPGVPGYTTGQNQLLDNPISKLNQRIDLILTFGPVVIQRIALFGTTQASKTPEGLWPSDHAAVVAQFNIQEHD